ncbi:MAG: VanZ family protein, partial [Flavobacteriaceae bacterium]|nr:VanZ family protein [Eudoraea sp.]NNJ38686.1 VanZ family protein [Flavobacteriaceae bacterium]
LLITVLSLLRFSNDPDGGLDIPHMDKAVHFLFYFVAAILGSLYLREATKRTISLSKALILSLLFAVVYGMIIEVIQSALTDYRSGEFEDILANSLGAITGVLLLKFLFSGKRQQKWKH